MSTTMPKAGEISRNWYILDATDKPLGRVAAKAAHILRGKHKPTFAPHVDCGDHVIIINCDKAVLTGKKLEQEKFYWHTGWIGGLKEGSRSSSDFDSRTAAYTRFAFAVCRGIHCQCCTKTWSCQYDYNAKDLSTYHSGA